MRPIKVIHVPYTSRNPYQKLLTDGLKELGLDVKGTRYRYLLNRSLFDITIGAILINYRRPDIIHIHWAHGFIVVKQSRLKTIVKSMIFLLQLLLAKIFGIKIVWTVHNLERHEKAHRDLERRFSRIFAQLSDIIIAHCETAKETIRNVLNVKCNEKITVIQHGNYIDYYSNTIDHEEAVKILSLSQSELKFLFLGEIRYYKGVLELIDAFIAIDRENTKLIIAGKPKPEKIVHEIETRISGNSKIQTVFQFIPDDELELYINAADVMVFPYRNIFTSGGIHLAMSFGKPIIAPLLGCIKNTLDPSGAILYDHTDSAGLQKALMKAFNIKDNLKKMGRYNLELAKKNSWNEIAQLTSQEYCKILKKMDRA